MVKARRCNAVDDYDVCCYISFYLLYFSYILIKEHFQVIRVLPIASGSTGNCMLICLGRRKLIVDLGVTASALKFALEANGISPEEIEAVLITHTHSDHIKGLKVCMKQLSAPLFMSSTTKMTLMCESASALSYSCRTQILPGLWITAFPTSHDCPGSVGFLIETESIRFGYATDLGIITDEILQLLSGSDCIVIESNHDEEMLRYGRYPVFLKKRILSDHGHLSNDSCAEAVAWLAERGTRHFLLAHLSQENNLPQIALRRTEKATSGMGISINVLPATSSQMLCFE